MSVTERRAAAVAETVAAVREIERRLGATRPALEEIKAQLIRLASRTELFPAAHFPVEPGSSGRVYRLSEDPDHRFALYASAGVPGKAQPPHNHTTWAVLAVVKGNACAFLADDFHTIEVQGDEPSLHLHMYGLSLEHLPNRISFASSSGGAYRVFPPTSGIAE